MKIKKTKFKGLLILNGIKHYPLRIKCATLGWHALKAAVTAADQTVSTE